MHAHVGDRIVVKAMHLDEPSRDGRILEVHGEDGAPPYLVEWSDDGHVSLFQPGPDSFIDHLGHDAANGPSPGSGAHRVTRGHVRPIAPVTVADEGDVLEQRVVVPDADEDYPHEVTEDHHSDHR